MKESGDKKSGRNLKRKSRLQVRMTDVGRIEGDRNGSARKEEERKVAGQCDSVRDDITGKGLSAEEVYDRATRRKCTTELHGGSVRPSYTEEVYDRATWRRCTTELHGGSVRPSYMEEVYDRATRRRCTTELHGGSVRPSYMEEVYDRATWRKCTTELHGGSVRPSYTEEVYDRATRRHIIIIIIINLRQTADIVPPLANVPRSLCCTEKCD